MTISIATIEKQGMRRGAEYVAAVKALGIARGEVMDIDDSQFHGLMRKFPSRVGLGDVVEMLAKPIAKAIGMDCLQPDGTLKPDSGCAKRRDAMNSIRI